jgi:hypothetical protein
LVVEQSTEGNAWGQAIQGASVGASLAEIERSGNRRRPCKSPFPRHLYGDVINRRVCNDDKYEIGPAKVQNGNDFAKVIEALRSVDNSGVPFRGARA